MLPQAVAQTRLPLPDGVANFSLSCVNRLLVKHRAGGSHWKEEFPESSGTLRAIFRHPRYMRGHACGGACPRRWPERSDRPMGHESETAAGREGITAAASRQWLERFEGTTEGRRVAEIEARLAGDIDLVTRLMFSGYEGQDWDEAANWLARYGLRVMTAWILDGTVVRVCREKGLAAPWNSRCHDQNEAESLAADVVSNALIKFRDNVLKPDIWRPDRGASLSSFFVGQCLIRWGNVYRQWYRGLRDLRPLTCRCSIGATDVTIRPGWSTASTRTESSTGSPSSSVG